MTQSSIKSPESKNGRTPLKAKNQQRKEESKQPKSLIEISSPKIYINTDVSNKENIPPPTCPRPGAKKAEIDVETTLIDASLAEELSAIREKLERMRLDKENTEKLLHDRLIALDMHINRLLKRGQVQTLLEIEVDRLYRLNQIITSSSSEVSPIRSLREKELERKIKENKSKDNIKVKDKSSCGELNSGCSSPLPQTPPQLGENDEIKNLSSEFEYENS